MPLKTDQDHREPATETHTTEPVVGAALGPDNWIASETGRSDPASEAWSLMHWAVVSNKQRFVAMARELDLSLQQMVALRMLGTGPRPMGELAKFLACDSSNVTGITDRLEELGLVRREPSEHDRRVKLLVITDKGEKLRGKITELMAEPPEFIAAISEADQIALRDLLRRALT